MTEKAQVTSDERRIGHALAATLFRLGPWAQTVSAIAGLVLVIGLVPTVPLERLVPWYLLLVASSVWRAWVIVRGRRVERVPESLVNEYRAGVLASGVIWGAAPFLTLPDFPLTQVAMIGMVLAGMTAGAVTVLSAVPNTLMLFAIPALGPLTAVLLTRGNLTAVGAGLLVVFAFVSVRRIERDLHRTLRSNTELSIDLADERDLANTTLDSLAEGVLRMAADGTVSYLNPAARRMLQADRAAPHYALADLLPDENEAGEDVVGRIVHEAGELGRDVDVDGQLWLSGVEGGRWLRVLARPLRRDAMSEREIVVVLQDVSKDRELIGELSYNATHDGLTGLPNRRALEEALEASVAAAKKDSEASGHLVFVDLDGFKAVNDTAGHKAGDRVLADVAEHMAGALRPNALLARVGGDEFAIVVRQLDEMGVAMMIEAIEAAVRAVPVRAQDLTLRVGASAGVARIDGSQTADEVLAAADRECYRIKEQRKLRARTADDAAR